MPTRNLNQFDTFDKASYRSLDSFMNASIISGILTIDYNGLPIDILNINRSSSTTLIVFHSALSPRMRSLPVFSGLTLAKSLGVNIISIADPTLALNKDLTLAWFLGSRQQPLITDLPRIINKILISHNGANPLYFGASGGGFAALLHSRNHVNAVTVVANPRIDLHAQPRQDLGPYLRHAFGAVGSTPAQRVLRDDIESRLQNLYESGHKNHIVYVQNFRDTKYYRDNMWPFIESLPMDENLHILLRDFGPGHQPIPNDLLRRILETIIASKQPDTLDLESIGFRTGINLDQTRQWGNQLLAEIQ